MMGTDNNRAQKTLEQHPIIYSPKQIIHKFSYFFMANN